MGKFWAHDAAAMEAMDREALEQEDEVAKLERLRDSDYEKYMRSGAADKLTAIILRRR